MQSWLCTCQNGVLMGIVSVEYGLCRSLPLSDPNATIATDDLKYTPMVKNGISILLYVVLLFPYVRFYHIMLLTFLSENQSIRDTCAGVVNDLL